MSNETLSYLEDLEIYTDCNDLEAIEQWLQNACEHFQVIKQSKKGCKFSLNAGEHLSQGMVVLNAGRTGFTSIWINSRHTPWQDDVIMGRAAYEALGGKVRCVESAWSKGDDPDQWLEISSDGEQIIQWVTEQ